MTDTIELEELFYASDSSTHGKGLFAKQLLEGESYLGTYDGRKTQKNGMHVLWVEDDDGEWYGRNGKNLLRWINHSQTPNTEFDGFDLYALRDIDVDEEIFIDYGDEFVAAMAEEEEA